MRLYVTHCDTNFLARALVMADSLQEHDKDAVLYIVLHDSIDLEHTKGESSENRHYLDLEEVKRFYPELRMIESERPKLEYMYALSPYLVKYFYDNFKSTSVTYVDADLHFYRSIAELTSKAATADIGLVSHRFKPKMQHLEKFGKFNVGIVQFNRTQNSLDTLSFWLDSCKRSTSTAVTNTIFGDQKYLESFWKFGKVFEFPGEGVNAAPWNTNNVNFSEHNSSWLVGEDPLYFYHFSGLKIFKRFATLSFIYYEWKPTRSIKINLFNDYIYKVIAKEIQIFGYRRIDTRKVKLRQLLNFLIAGDLIIIKKRLRHQ